MLPDRRQYQRVIPDARLSVRCGQSQSRLLFDLCEEGMAVDGLAADSPAEVIPLLFDLPDGYGRIEAKGEIAWTNDSDNRVGLRFVELADTYRQQVRKWISANVYTTDLIVAAEEAAQPQVFLAPEGDSVGFLAQQPAVNQGLSRYPTSPYLMLFVLATLSLFSGIAFVRHYPGVGNRWQGKEIMAAGKVREIPTPSSTASVEPPPAPTPSLPVTLPLSVPGFVLQVAAMKHEDNADALAKALQKKNFPAFVFKRGANPFYRVAVGAYGDPDSAHRVKDELKAQGFKSILKHWSPA